MPTELTYEKFCENFLLGTENPSLKEHLILENIEYKALYNMRESLNNPLNLWNPPVLFQGSAGRSFFTIECVAHQENNCNRKFLAGWKFHVSIDDSNGRLDNLIQGWNIVQNEILYQKHQKWRVLKQKSFGSARNTCF